ncbi:MAG: hypothetical protein A4E42_00993 [Methanoregulaceae archaeon PtaU1.Bin222]|nr:MAG: hypothetical protein A4E42_00993 [Methanoregulaceae archaeon PtaU1.Bin222]
MSCPIFWAFILILSRRSLIFGSSVDPCSVMRMEEKPSMARNGARRSCETEYENASSSRFATSRSAVLTATRVSSSSLSLRSSPSTCFSLVMSTRIPRIPMVFPSFTIAEEYTKPSSIDPSFLIIRYSALGTI